MAELRIVQLPLPCFLFRVAGSGSERRIYQMGCKARPIPIAASVPISSRVMG